jgi:ketopantoate reductase
MEIDARNGTIVRLVSKHGIQQTPVNQSIVALLEGLRHLHSKKHRKG